MVRTFTARCIWSRKAAITALVSKNQDLKLKPLIFTYI